MVAFGVAVNLLGARIAARLALPLYMDTIGTMLVASLGGYLPGIVSGLLSPVAGALEDPTMLSYGMLNVMLAVMCAFYTDHGWFKKFRTAVLAVLSFAFVGGCLGSLLTWFLYGFAQEDTSAGLVGFFYRTGVFNPFAAELLADYLIDVLDKGITVALLLLVFYFLPAPFRGQFHLHLWRQQPLTAEAKQAAGRVKNRSVSLRIRLMIMLVIAGFMIGLIALAISFALFMESTEKQRTAFGLGIGRTAAGLVNGDDVDRFLQGGEREEGYQETRELLQILKDSAPEIKYLYIYQIRADGCHVVFDPDTELFRPIYDSLLTNKYGTADKYFILADFRSYAEAQKRVEEAYRDTERWAKMAMMNTFSSGKFSSDRTIEEYVRDIWKLDRIQK